MLVTSKLSRHVTIGANHVQITADMSVAVQAKEKARAHGPIVLVPGTNEVDAADWAKVENYPTLRHYLNSGEVVPRKVESLKDMAPDAAGKLVADTWGLGLLDKWEGSESRRPVLKAIAAQKKLIADQIAKADSETEPRGKADA